MRFTPRVKTTTTTRCPVMALVLANLTNATGRNAAHTSKRITIDKMDAIDDRAKQRDFVSFAATASGLGAGDRWFESSRPDHFYKGLFRSDQ